MMLYIHIPFCVKKCGYCDFLSYPGMENRFQDYVNALCLELFLRSEEATTPLSSIYIGGGTPSILPVHLLSQIFSTIEKNYELEPDAEVTLECNPKTVNATTAIEYTHLPINRISIGLQSIHEKELLALSRAHTYKEFEETYQAFDRAGYKNINVDIMTGIPHQTIESLLATIDKVVNFSPTHISTYALILEEGTPFYEAYESDRLPLPDEDLEYSLYSTATSALGKFGYNRYEISNYARDQKYSRHNLGYWNRTPYIGVGLGAASFVNAKRHVNVKDLDKYLCNCFGNRPPFIKTIELSQNDEMAEFMFLGLRQVWGIKKSDFKDSFGIDLNKVYGTQIEKLSSQGLLVDDGNSVYLTSRGIDISNIVLSEFLLD